MIAWAKKGIVGRGVLIDYWTWSQKHAPYNPLETYSIPLTNLKKCIDQQNLQFQSGDILFIRSGFVTIYSTLDIPTRQKLAAVNPTPAAGVEQSEQMLEWIWNNQFSAVAGDAPAFEAWRIYPLVSK
jgi:hypothetical protein